MTANGSLWKSYLRSLVFISGFKKKLAFCFFRAECPPHSLVAVRLLEHQAAGARTCEGYGAVLGVGTKRNSQDFSSCWKQSARRKTQQSLRRQTSLDHGNRTSALGWKPFLVGPAPCSFCSSGLSNRDADRVSPACWLVTGRPRAVLV